MAQNAQSDPWEEAAKAYKPEASATSPANDPWAASGESAGGSGNAFQQAVDSLTQVTPEQRAGHSLPVNMLQDFGAHVLGSVLQPIAHPMQTLQSLNPDSGAKGAAEMALGPIGAPLVHMGESVVNELRNQPLSVSVPAIAGDITGAYLGGKGTEGLGEAAGPAMQQGGAGLINKAAGMLKSDFKFGAKPGEAYLEGGGKPAYSMGNLADQAERVRSNAGSQLRPLYEAAGEAGKRIPAEDVFNAVAEPSARLRNIAEGFGGTGASPDIEAYESRVINPLLEASERGGFTPSELFEEKRNMAENTRWNDPTKFDMNQVRQQATGGIGGLLSDAVPEVRPLNKIYQGASNLADRARLRAETGTPPLSALVHRGAEAALGAGLGYATHNPLLAALPLAADTVPVKTTLGYGLYHAGKSLARTPNLSPLFFYEGKKEK